MRYSGFIFRLWRWPPHSRLHLQWDFFYIPIFSPYVPKYVLYVPYIFPYLSYSSPVFSYLFLVWSIHFPICSPYPPRSHRPWAMDQPPSHDGTCWCAFGSRPRRSAETPSWTRLHEHLGGSTWMACFHEYHGIWMGDELDSHILDKWSQVNSLQDYFCTNPHWDHL